MIFASIIIGCKEDNYMPSGDDVTVDLHDNYIHFDVGISTRAALIEGNVLTDNFDVLGYQYRGEWSSEEVMAVPNVFEKENSQGHVEIQVPLKVTYNPSSGGYFTYDPPQPWTGNKYSFFGYYPSIPPDKSGPIKLFDNNNVRTGTPYITYTLPIFLKAAQGNGYYDPRELLDLLTGFRIDTKFGVASNVVLNMKHRLAALDLGIYNNSEYEYVAGGETKSKPLTLEIVGCEVKLKLVKEAKIYLDYNEPTEPISYAYAKFSFINPAEPRQDWELGSIEIPNTGDNIFKITKDGVKDSDQPATTLLLVPHDGNMEGKICIKYKKRYQGDNGEWIYLVDPVDGDQIFETQGLDASDALDINFSREFVEGRRYYIEVTFTSNAITVQSSPSDEWTDQNVTHEFE